ncbi:DMT family transporter [Parafrigoribacterium humi]|jgi:drug/metabolite transporter (DMT)-like permease|uniref:DMT family transporter n=1 Tax=Parafrigoribacterium humi TaxID=3144664 RepID=UPI0032EAB390
MMTTLCRFRVDLLLLVVAASWGSTYLVTKELVTPSSVIALLSVRMLLATALMAVIVVARRARSGPGEQPRLTRAGLGVGVVLGVLLAAVFVCETSGIAHTSATNAGLIISLTMVFTPILESVVARRRLPGGFFLAALVAVVGVALLAGVGAFEAPGPGDLLILGAAVIRAVHVVAMHRLTEGRSGAPASPRPAVGTLTLTTVQLSTCAVLFTVASAFIGDSVPAYLGTLGGGTLALFAYLVVICTVFAFVVQMWAVRRTSPARVSLLLGTEPLWAAIVGVGIAHDTLDAAGWCGMLLVLVGTFWGRRVEQRHREDAAQSERKPALASRRLS